MLVPMCYAVDVIDHPNREVTRKIQRVFQEIVPHPWIGRKLRRLFREAGLTKLALRAVPTVFVDPTHSGLLGAIENFAQQGILDVTEVAEYTEVIEQLQGEEAFTSGMMMWVVRGFRPMGQLQPLQPIEDIPDHGGKKVKDPAIARQSQQSQQLQRPQQQQPQQQRPQQQKQKQKQQTLDSQVHDAATTIRLLRGTATQAPPRRPTVKVPVADADAEPDGIMQFVDQINLREGLVNLPTGV